MRYKAHLGKGIVFLSCMATANIAMSHEELLPRPFYDVHLAGVQICIIILYGKIVFASSEVLLAFECKIILSIFWGSS